MKAVLISIQPKWCELIAHGKKTLEIRKTKPKLEKPFKVYIYCTQNKERLIEVIHDGDDMGDFIHRGKPNFIKAYTKDWSVYGAFKGGKVIGEFICKGIMQPYNTLSRMAKESCLTEQELLEYSKGKELYGWRIADLVIYDKPKELSEFYISCGDNPKCEGCEAHYYSNTECGKEDYCCSIIEGYKPIKRPPQSWCYVEEK